TSRRTRQSPARYPAQPSSITSSTIRPPVAAAFPMSPCAAEWRRTGTTRPHNCTREPRMTDLRIGFIGLGNVGSQLAGNLLRHGVELTVHDIDATRVAAFVARGARAAASPRELAGSVDVVITCLPSPAVCAAVMEGEDGVLAGLAPSALWLEMSTTDHE